MEIRLSQVLTVAAGVIVFDFVTCKLIAPKVFDLLGLGVQRQPACHCGGGCGSCAKNITDRAQVIDVTAVKRQGVSVSV